jgi:hypothetical protein
LIYKGFYWHGIYNFIGPFAYWNAGKRGDILPYDDTSLDARPPLFDKPWVIPIPRSSKDPHNDGSGFTINGRRYESPWVSNEERECLKHDLSDPREEPEVVET